MKKDTIIMRNTIRACDPIITDSIIGAEFVKASPNVKTTIRKPIYKYIGLNFSSIMFTVESQKYTAAMIAEARISYPTKKL